MPQSFIGGECIWSDQAGVTMVLVWFLQEAQGNVFTTIPDKDFLKVLDVSCKDGIVKGFQL